MRPGHPTALPLDPELHLEALLVHAEEHGARRLVIMPPGRPRMDTGPGPRLLHWHELPTVPGARNVSASRLRALLTRALGTAALDAVTDTERFTGTLKAGLSTWNVELARSDGLLLAGFVRQLAP